jgi:L-ribulose-5-phosphate 3-epimerase
VEQSISRRKFLKASSAATLAGARVLSASPEAPPRVPGPFTSTICLFSKSVPQMNWQELAKGAKSVGFGGIDLTVRPDGHVMPERAAEDLPKAVEAIRAEGLEVPMITTALVRADDPTAIPILSTAEKLSIPFFKPGYYHYKFVDVRKEVEEAGNQFRGLAKLAERYRMQVGYHNHAGYIGCQFWEIAPAMFSLDAKWAGFYYDIENATSEGGYEGWKIGAALAMPRMKMMAVKDLYWEKTESGVWREKLCPLGEGICRLKEFFKMAAVGGFHGPISLHMEYEIPGVSNNQGIALSRDTDDAVLAAAGRNLATLKPLLHEAYEGS